MPVAAQDTGRTGGLDRFAPEALSTFGLVAIPNETVNAFSLQSISGDTNAFRSIQLGGGRRLWPDIPIWTELYVGLQRYDPRLLISSDEGDLTLRAKWTGVAATGGFGWDHEFAPGWHFRPMLNLSLGRVLSDLSAEDGPDAPPSGPNLDLLGRGGLTVGGIGASMLFSYYEQDRFREIDMSFRYTYLNLQTLRTANEFDTSSDVATAAGWFRARYPIQDYTFLGRPLRSVYEASISAYPGDQGELLGIDWLASAGVGLEIDTSGSGVPFLSSARLIARYVIGDDYSGYSLGLGISF